MCVNSIRAGHPRQTPRKLALQGIVKREKDHEESQALG